MTEKLIRPLGFAGLSAVFSVIVMMWGGLPAACVLFVAAAAAAFVFCVLRNYYTAKYILVFLLVFACSGLRFFYMECCVVAPSLRLCEETADISGTVYAAANETENSVMIPLKDCTVNGVETKLRINLYVKTDPYAQIGDTLNAENVTFFEQSDKNEYYYHTLSSGCWLRAYAKSADVFPNEAPDLLCRLAKFRNDVTSRLLRSMGQEAGGIAAALLIGDKSALTDSFQRDLRVSGTSHLFAVSGMHLSVWTGVLFYILQKGSRNKKLPNLIAILFVLLYMFLTGLSPSVIRAGVMLIAVFTGKLFRRQSDPLNSLGLASLILLGGNIYLAGNISFLLSGLATFGLVALYPYFQFHYKKGMLRLQRKLINTNNAAAVSLIAVLFTVPAAGFFFGSASLLSPVSSILCTAPAEMIMVGSFLSVSFGFIPYVGTAICFVTEKCVQALRWIVHGFGNMDYLMIAIDFKKIMIWYLITGALMLLVYRFRGKNSKKVLLVLLGSVCLLIASVIGKGLINGSKTEICIPAGANSTNVCILSNNGRYCAMIGTGASYKDYRKMQKYLQKNGVYTVDDLIIPRLSDAENGRTAAYSAAVKNLYTPMGNEADAAFSGNIFTAANYTVKLGNGMTYVNRLQEEYAAGMLQGNGLKIVFSFRPGGDFSAVEDAFATGDYLICRGGVPKGAAPENYGKVIVLSDKSAKALRLPDNVISTADVEDIIIKTAVSRR